MSDLPLEGRKSSKVTPKPKTFDITKDNAAVYTAYYTLETYKRLGYLIKLLESRKNV